MLAKSSHFQRLTLVLDNVIATLAWILAVHAVTLAGSLSYEAFYSHIALLVLVVPVQAWAFQANKTERLNLAQQAFHLSRSIGIVAIVLFAAVFLLKLDFASRRVVLSYAALSFSGILLARFIIIYWYFHIRKEQSENYTKILIVGSGARAHRIADQLERSGDWGTEILGFIDPEDHAELAETSNGGFRQVVTTLAQFESLVSAHVIDEVVIAVPRRLLGTVEPFITSCDAEGIRIRLAVDLYEINAASAEMSKLGGIPTVIFQPVAQNVNMLIVKRIFDLSVTVAALPVLVPLFLLIGAAVKLDSPGPAFFKQTRVGMNKRRFTMYKFRSMLADAEARMSEVEHLNEADGPIFKIRNDPRVTRVGRFIRKTSLDELPQLINVVLGQMSLVGPRPMSVRDVDLFEHSIQRRRFSVRPGCTCTWQISGRSDLPFEKWLELDLDYIDNWNFLLDLKILLLTVPTVLKGSGAV